jgi:hypothetical protein
MNRKLAALATAIAATGALALAAPAMAGTGPPGTFYHLAPAAHVNSVANGVNVTTNNGVAGYYSFGSPYRNLEFDVTTAVAAENMIPGQDGVGGQLCNNLNGKTVGAGEVYNGDGTFSVVVGIGRLHGNAAAHPVSSRSNMCLGGLLPTSAISHVSPPLDAVPTTDDVRFNIHVYHSATGLHRWHVHFQATDVTVGTDVWSFTHRLPLSWGNPHFNQAGVGSQRSTAHLSSPASNVLASFATVGTDNGNGPGCNLLQTVQVNSSGPSANNDSGTEPNPFGQVDPDNSLSGSCEFNAFNVYVGNPVA